MDAFDAMTRQAKVMPVALQGFPVGANRYLPYSDVALFNVECVDFAISVLRLGDGARLFMVIFEGLLLSLIAFGSHCFYGAINGSSGNLCSIVRDVANAFGNIAYALSNVTNKCEWIKAWHCTTFPLDNQTVRAPKLTASSNQKLTSYTYSIFESFFRSL